MFVFIAYASSERSEKPVMMHSLVRALDVDLHRVGMLVKFKLLAPLDSSRGKRLVGQTVA